MTSIINKEKFVADCVLDYRTGDEYDLTLVYDQFFTLSNIDESLYDELYLLVEKALVDEYESDAETDDKNS
jgi:hypothetical protein